MQRVEKSVRVHAPVDQVYQFWRDFENFPRFMEHVESVQVRDAGKRLPHWKLKGPVPPGVVLKLAVAPGHNTRLASAVAVVLVRNVSVALEFVAPQALPISTV